MAAITPAEGASATEVSADERIGKSSLSMSWWTLCSAVFYLYLAPVLAISFGAANAIIGIVLAVICFSAISYVFTRRSISLGLSAESVSERVFGKNGAVLVALVLAVTALYYGIFEGSVLAFALVKVFPDLSYLAACLIVVGLTLPFIWSGKILLHIERVNFLLLPLYLIGIVALFVMAGNRYGWSSAWLQLGPENPSPYGWWDCFVAYMGVMVLLVITVDFARFGRREDARFHALVTFGLPFYLVTFLMNGLIGIFLVGTVGVLNVSETAVVDATLAILGGAVGLAFLTATQMRINLANFFVATQNISAVLQKCSFRVPNYAVVLGVAAIAVVLMASEGVFKYMLVSLQYMGIALSSWIGVVLFAGKYVEQDGVPAALIKPTTVSWLASSAFGAAISFGPATISVVATPASFVMAVVLCLVTCERHPG